MSQQDQEVLTVPEIDLKNMVCDFCKTSENDEMRLGKKYTYRKIKVHYFCLLLSSEAYQSGEEYQGILGFMPSLILKVRKKARRTHCCYCKKNGASLVCCEKTCKKVFHLPCGIREKCITHYFDQFETYCDEHAPTQVYTEEDRLYSLTNSRYDNACGICYENLLFEISYYSLWAPCCRNGWFHRDCVLTLAHSAGHAHFKCPLCNNKDIFVNEMQRLGIYVPYKDAAWELEPGAYHDLYIRYNQCDADPCLCPFDRTHNGQYDTDWMLLLCQLCGSSGMHRACLQKQQSTSNLEKYRCNFCLSTNKCMSESGIANSSNLSQNQSSFRLVKRKRPDVGLQCAESQMRKLPPINNDLLSSGESDIDVVIVDNSEEEIPTSSKNPPTESNIDINSARSSGVSQASAITSVELVTSVVAEDKNNDNIQYSQYEASQGSEIDPRPSHIISTTIEVHNSPTVAVISESNKNALAKIVTDTGFSKPLQLPKSKQVNDSLYNMNPTSRLSYINSPKVSKSSKKSSGLNPFALDSYKKPNLSPPKKKKAIENLSNQATSIKLLSDKYSHKETELKMNLDKKSINTKSVQNSPAKVLNDDNNILNRNIIEVLGNHPSDKIKTHFTTDFWLKQRNMSKHNKHLYHDGRKKNSKESYATPHWKQKMLQIREKVKLGTNDIERTNIKEITRESYGLSENISVHEDVLHNIEHINNEQEKNCSNVVQNHSEVQQNMEFGTIADAINIKANEDKRKSGGADVQVNHKSYTINNSQTAGPSNVMIDNNKQKSQRIPAYKKIVMDKTERLRSEMENALNTNCKEDVLQADFANVIAHSTLNELNPSINSIDLSENSTQGSNKLPTDNKVNKFKSAMSKLKAASVSNNKDVSEESIKSKHDECLESFRLAKKNFTESKRKYVNARTELMLSKAAYEIAEKELYDEILKSKLKEKHKHITE